MTSSAPAPVAWGILVFCLVAAVLRLWWLPGRARSSERLVTYGLLLGTASGLLRERAVQDGLADLGLLSVGFTRQLSTVVMVLTFAPLCLLAISWSERWSMRQGALWRPVWASAYASGLAMVAVGTHARSLGQYIDRTEGWQTPVYFAFFSVWCGATGALMLFTSVRELRAGELRPTHRLTYLMISIVGAWALEEAVSIFVSAMCASTGTGRGFVEFRFQANENNYIYLLACGAVVAAAGVVAESARRLRIDPASRAVRRLAPMWEALVEACPEIPRPARSDTPADPRRRVHRMTVEIRDALLVLGRYAEPTPDGTAGAEAVQIVRALRRKRSGAPPGQYLRLQASAPGRDVLDETRALRRIAAHWHDAQRYPEAIPALDGDSAR
ncbi:MAB_1171c family putative transporter [Nocardia sp. BMG51109]|uniref:MAB_1171c family putative transporter n=1 Tax=Nocardia sp. BMG51109 TaxID=1056816 RepID=UPI0004B0A039|nr:MAB_1171c family putative transporter [Nocardia sp. BMG51109]